MLENSRWMHTNRWVVTHLEDQIWNRVLFWKGKNNHNSLTKLLSCLISRQRKVTGSKKGEIVHRVESAKFRFTVQIRSRGRSFSLCWCFLPLFAGSQSGESLFPLAHGVCWYLSDSRLFFSLWVCLGVCVTKDWQQLPSAWMGCRQMQQQAQRNSKPHHAWSETLRCERILVKAATVG